MPFQCDVQGPASGVDSRGSPNTGYVSLFQVKCRTAPVGQPTEAMNGDVLQSASLFLVSFPRGTDVRENHRLVVTGTIADVDFTQTLDVIGIRGPRTNEIHRSVLARAVPEPAT